MQVPIQQAEIELSDSTDKSSTSKFISPTQRRNDSGPFRKQSHLRLMLLKNYLIYRRQATMTIFLLLSPIIICFMIVFWQAIVDRMKNFLVINPPIVPQMEYLIQSLTSTLPYCKGSSDCVSVGYFVLGEEEEWIERVMKHVAKANHMEFGNDVKFILQANDPNAVTNYLSSNLNKTQIAVVFCTDHWNLSSYSSISIPCKFDRIGQKMVFYTIFYNYSLLYKVPYLSDMRQSYPKDAIASKLKVSLDNAILYEFSKEPHKNPDKEYLTVSTQDYPKIPNRFIEGIDVAGNYGAFYFFAPYLLCFLMTINELLQEKGKKLRQGLVVMGLSHFQYWLSWIITIVGLVALLTVIMIISGCMMGFDLFLKAPLPILFILFFTFGFAVQLLAFFIATVCPDVKTGYTIAYGFILTAIIMQMFFTQSFLTILFYRADSSQWVEFIRVILSLYPAFKYSMIYSDISQKACKHYSLEENRWVEGEGFKYQDLFHDYDGKFTLEKEVGYGSPSAIENYFHLCLSCLFYIALTYYFDHVLASNRGRSESLLFCVTNPINACRRLWRSRRRLTSPIQLSNDMHHVDYSDLNTKDSAGQEIQRVLYNHKHQTEVQGLRVIGLTKTYRRYPLGYQSSEDVHALKDVHFEMEKGELLALLGHNGAGKTTLIGVLTGMLEADIGTAQVFNYDIQNSMDSIRKIMGVCPQFDILWNQLTAGEHLSMYAAIKGVNDIEREVEDRLREVDLLHVKNAQISTFSGGMKRRVSLAISAIGNPRIIILDEPTTGMDPKARRQVWQMIKNLKAERVVLLTTHAMEEADALSDRIAVMAEGQLRCIGTSLYLKNNFSDGYRLNIVCDSENKDVAIRLIRKVLPESRLLDSAGGSLVFSIPLSKIPTMKPFFQIIENEQNIEQDQLSEDEIAELRAIIKDWGLSHATLEEVFMKVTRKVD